MIKLKIIRIEKGLTQYRIASLTGMSQSKYSAIERGDIRANAQDKRKIAEVLSIDVKEIWPNS